MDTYASTYMYICVYVYIYCTYWFQRWPIVSYLYDDLLHAGHRCQTNGCGYTLVVEVTWRTTEMCALQPMLGMLNTVDCLGEFELDVQILQNSSHITVYSTNQQWQYPRTSTPSSAKEEDQVGMIIGKRETWNSVLYEAKHLLYTTNAVKLAVRKVLWC